MYNFSIGVMLESFKQPTDVSLKLAREVGAQPEKDIRTAVEFLNNLIKQGNIDCAKNGTECISPAKDGVEIMRILDAIYESARTGHEVVLQ